jgi:predicted small lipoprotein YifL
MRWIAVVLIAVAACGKSGPVAIRPGSNVALPVKRPSIAEQLARSLVCEKVVGEPETTTVPEDHPCFSRPDSLAPSTKPAVPTGGRKP